MYELLGGKMTVKELVDILKSLPNQDYKVEVMSSQIDYGYQGKLEKVNISPKNKTVYLEGE